MNGWKDILAFLKYIVKQPFIDLWHILQRFNYPKAWMYFGIVAFLYSVFGPIIAQREMLFGDKIAKTVFFIITVISFLWFEYSKGQWKYEQRQEWKKRGLNENERNR
jgi:hypothetical protein